MQFLPFDHRHHRVSRVRRRSPTMKGHVVVFNIFFIVSLCFLVSPSLASDSKSGGSSPGAGGLWGHAQFKWGDYNAVADSDPHNLPKGDLDCYVEGPSNVTYKKEKGPYTFYLVPTRFCLQVGF